MKGKLCFGLLLLSFITAGLSLNACSDVSALRHEYLGIPFLRGMIPVPSFDSQTNSYFLDWNYGGVVTGYGQPFELEFEGDASSPIINSFLEPTLSNSFLIEPSISNNKYTYYGLRSIIHSNSNYTGLTTSSSHSSQYYPSDWRFLTDNEKYYLRSPFGTDKLSYDVDSIPITTLTCEPLDNGANCPGLWGTRDYVQDKVLPYWYSYDGFYLKSRAIDTDTGVTYSNTFSFDDLLNTYVPTFSKLRLPLHDYDGYFYDSSNLYQGRQIEFSGAFEFDGSFAWHDNISTNGSYFRIEYSGYTKSSSQPVNSYFDCTANLVTLDNLTRLEYSCPFTFDADYIVFNPALVISGNGNYIWVTDAPWRFAFTYLTTDNDDTPGSSFNGELTGGGDIPGDASLLIGSGEDQDWFSNLIDLFSFNFFNPFAPLFTMFSDNNSCASIPTLAGMLHSSETQVCPFFDSTTRNIVTPVLGMASMMLVFGFAVRWLGSSSGNLFEDSRHEELSNQSGHWERRKK